jgi:DNA helicase-2/ATP-dependent DNA helicase PcrA
MEGIDSLYINEDDSESEKGKIVISTIHQSKGLEFESVHIANMNEFSIPFIREDEEGDPEKLEEEFCAAYVACTRAKKYLRMYMQSMNGVHYQAKPNKISRFIKEVYKNSKEQYFDFRILDIPNEQAQKDRIYRKLQQGY